jgi:iron complex outermembrane recepter protein
MKTMRKLCYAGVVAAISVTALPNLASAQNAMTIEEVVVTARKKEEKLQDIPMTVSALTTEDIDNRSIQSIDDIARFAPGLSFSKAFGRATDRPVIRGLGNVLAGVQFGVEAGAAYFVDGVYYPGDIQGIDLANLVRVEVIKGPQSALYGRNTYSGAINFITRDPSDEFSGGVRIIAAEDGEQDVRFNVSGPIIDNILSGSLSVRTYQFDGQWTNTVTNKTIGDESTDSASLALNWTPNDKLSIKLRASTQEDDDGTRPLFLQSAADNNCEPGYRSLAYWPASLSSNNNQYYCGAIKPGTIALNDLADADGVPNAVAGVPVNSFLPSGTTFFGEPYALNDGTAFDGVERDLNLFSLAASYELNSGHVLSLSTSMRDEELRTGSDSDHSSINFKFAPTPFNAGQEAFFGNSTWNDVEDNSFEVRLESPADAQVSWLVGAFYYNQDKDTLDITFANQAGLLDSQQEVTNKAFFASADFDLNDKMSVTIEARYQEEEKSYTEWAVDIAGNSTTRQGFDDASTWYSFTPRITLDYRLSDDVMLYAIYAEGVKPGGFNGDTGAAVGSPGYLQEESSNYEFGLKSSLFDGRVLANASVFFIDATDIQLTTGVATPTGAVNSIATNQGEGEVFGVELDLKARLTDSLTAGFNYALADSEFTSGCDDFEWVLTSGGGKWQGSEAASTNYTGNGTCSIKGNQFPLSSKHQASAFIDFETPIGQGGMSFFANADVSYESKKYVQVHNRAYSPEATLVGARLGIRGDNWSITAFGKNLTDEDAVPMTTRWLQVPYFTFASVAVGSNIPGADTGTPRAFFGALRRERQLGLELTYNF